MSELDRFVTAQDMVWEQVLAELRAGHKQTHWMWFVFPQMAGLGTSAMTQHYAIAGLEEARAYLAHPVLGPRLRQCAGLVLMVTGKTAHDMFGSPDDVKFRSSMTLFDRAAPGNVFCQALEKYFAGQSDSRTLERLLRP